MHVVRSVYRRDSLCIIAATVVILLFSIRGCDRGARSLSRIINATSDVEVVGVSFYGQQRRVDVLDSVACKSFTEALRDARVPRFQNGQWYRIRIDMSDGSNWTGQGFISESDLELRLWEPKTHDDAVLPTHSVQIPRRSVKTWDLVFEFLQDAVNVGHAMVVGEGGQIRVNSNL